MSEIRVPIPAASNLPEFTVGEISQAVKRTLEGAFDRVRGRGEISGFKRHSSGHCYFTLKHADPAIDGVCWRGTAILLHIHPDDSIPFVVIVPIPTSPRPST